MDEQVREMLEKNNINEGVVGILKELGVEAMDDFYLLKVNDLVGKIGLNTIRSRRVVQNLKAAAVRATPQHHKCRG